MLFKLINPSDDYTLEADDLVSAGFAVYAGLSPAYGVVSIDDPDQQSPILFGWEQWLESHGIVNVSEHVENNYSMLADILESVLIGDKEERERFIEEFGPHPPADDPDLELWLQFREQRHDELRSSMNDIGRKAWRGAKAARKLLAEKEAEK